MEPGPNRYPGFEICCKEKKQTILELPNSVQLSVDEINYKSREIVVHDPDFCLRVQLQNLTLSASPFNFKLSNFFLEDFVFFNCSTSKKEDPFLFWSIPCSFLPSNQVYAVASYTDLDLLDLSSCHKMYDNVTVLPLDMVELHKSNFSLLVKQRRIFFIHNHSVSLYVHIYRDSRDPTIKLFL